MYKYKVMVVDDEESLCEILKFNLEKEGYEVTTANSAEEVLTLNLKGLDLMILDIMMGELSGFNLAAILRKRPETQTFSVAEVMARVRSVLRRSTHRAEQHQEVVDENVISFEGLVINNSNKRCSVDGTEISLTRKEFDILVLLLQNRNTILSREQIMKRVWSNEVIVLDRTIDVNITRMRKKLGVYGNHIITRTGYGYGFEE